MATGAPGDRGSEEDRRQRARAFLREQVRATVLAYKAEHPHDVRGAIKLVERMNDEFWTEYVRAAQRAG